jgi:hypothetical protein
MAPVAKHHSNLPPNPRWSLLVAEREFGVDRETIKKRLAALSTEPGADGCYSTLEIASGIYGDIFGERLRKTRAEATHTELLNAAMEKKSLPSDDVYHALEIVFSTMKSEIMGSGMPEHVIHSLLSQLSEIEIPS